MPDPVYVDADMWERVVLNLVSNAFKYTLEGKHRVTVRAADEQHCRAAVSDTGVGIPAHELPRIFDRFHRIEGTGGRTMEGTGIGLALVHELVRLHGGTIGVREQTGHRHDGVRRVAARVTRTCRPTMYRTTVAARCRKVLPPRPLWKRRCAGCRKRDAARHRDAGILDAGAGGRVRRTLKARTGRCFAVFCWPTTTPICATTSCVCWEPDTMSESRPDGEAALRAVW